MNYKKIITSRKLRLTILRLLSFIPDRIMVHLQYRIHSGRKLNLKNPTRYTEKIQHYKLNYRNPMMLRCTDKYEVRNAVAEMGAGNYLVPLYGVYDSVDNINFESLPNQFVAKTSDGGGGQQVYICRDKTSTDKKCFFKVLNEWMSVHRKQKSLGREWAYENGFKRKIIIEKLLTDGKHMDIPDYKFWCFNGKPEFCQVIGNRTTGETIDFFDLNWNHMPFVGLNPACVNDVTMPEKPAQFEEMKEVVAILARRFPFVRVDLYNANGKVYFGELTFYPASGYGRFVPDEWDARIGDMLELPVC